MAPDDTDDFASMLAQFEKETGTGQVADAKKRKKDPKVGETVRVRVVKVGGDAVFVELGAKAEGMIDLVSLRDADGHVSVQVGEELDARVVQIGGKAGCIVLRPIGGARPVAKAELVDAAEHGFPVEGTVTGVNKGGVEVTVAGVRGFCPISQLDSRHVADAQAFVGQKLAFRITKYDPSARGGGDLVLSRRAVLEEEAASKARATREKLAPGAVMKGVVTSLKDYGAFVDLGGLEGMIHVSELGFTRVAKPSDVLQPGQPVEVVVLKIQPAEGKQGERIALSLKALAEDPWQTLADKTPVGSRVKGKVVRLETFGAFLEIAPGVEGLLHVSELAPGNAGQPLRHAKDRAKLGDVFEVIVNAIDVERRRVSLGLTAKIDAETVDAEGAKAAAAPRSLGTFADLFNSKNKKR